MHLLTVTAAMLVAMLSLQSEIHPEWPQWRGPFNTGMAAGDAPMK